MIYLLTCLLAQAETNVPSQYQFPQADVHQVQSVPFFHGPDGPPPDGGYTITDGEGGNFFGKLGVVCLGAGLVTGVLSLTTDDMTAKSEYQNASIGLLGGGIGLIVLERVF